MARVLYLSYDGLTDPLGQSQILPYLEGLSKLGYSFDLVSFEKPEPFQERKSIIEERCRTANIEWHPLSYTKSPPVFSTVYDLMRMWAEVKRILQSKEIELVHVRSYIPAIIALKIKERFGLPFIFDKRGFWIEERIEGGIWNPNNLLIKQVIQYFKKNEIRFFTESKRIVSLTQVAKNALKDGKVLTLTDDILTDIFQKTDVIPCAADEAIFNFVNPDERLEAKRRNHIPEEDLVFLYLGSLGTWYLLDEMLLTYKGLLKQSSKLWFIVYSSTPATDVIKRAIQLKVPIERIKVEFVNREDLREKLSVADLSINFMRPGHSRLATSPVKIGELLSMGIPFITNRGIGDSESQIKNFNAGVVMSERPTYNELEKIDLYEILAMDKERISQEASNYFSLNSAVLKYKSVYEKAIV